MKNIKLYTLLILSIALFYKCDDGLSELNIDPNSAVQVAPETLLSTAQYTFYNALHGTGINSGWGLLMVQYWAENEYTDDSRYNQDITSFGGTWSAMYANVLKELDAAKTLVDAQNVSDAIKNNQKAIIDVMSAQVYAFMTDGFGSVPYTEALGEDTSPAYDSQEVIYKGILETLDNASKSFNTSAPSFNSGELVYNGNVASWIKFTNSLMLRYAMRIVDVDPATANTYINIASANLMDDNSDSGLFVFDSNPARANPMFRNASPLVSNRDDFAVSEYLVQTLEGLGDPRLAEFAKETATGDFVGMPYGLVDNAATALKPSTSRPNDNVRAATAPHVIMSYSEVQFLLAEAYQRGSLTGNAADAYSNGVSASMNYWGINNATAIEAYVTSNPYNAANWKESVGVQKWIAFYMNGFEAWNEWRRLDYPVLAVPADAVIQSIPVKMPYVLAETQTNSASLNAVTSTPANMTTKVWWDVN
ncbi:SusD/RagB family nutrient-binding outer membrane lipoprotein [Polaribacter litorisediminis]|uniref:SusD/RagB family nutrient-binding outer membrane lipoprotein n=1 Tax=Polaribacter litorisediminis TaxID=1908341 RepID=UPI001CBAF146|nr:SusD/RagB family nutrient-binding outer membrane lipoprotein [Polaribacter litorisediminis]UAM98482.1 SusD/RagB family nutrient-binding outer membrane lipoprotein [Polaribacter litorisediminis]